MKTKMILCGLMLIACGLFAADEITLSGAIKAAKNFSLAQEQPGSINIDWAGGRSYQNVSVLGTGQVALAIATITTNGYAFFRNISTNETNTVSIAFRGEKTTPDLQLKAGEFAIFRMGSSTLVTNIYAWTAYDIQAQLYYRILEN